MGWYAERVVLSSDERDRFLMTLRSDAAFREEVRREVLSAELLELPQRFAAFVEEMRAFREEMHAFVLEMRAFRSIAERRLEALESVTGCLTDDSAKLRGMILEQKIRGNPGYYLSRYARRVKLADLDGLLDDLGIADMGDGDYEALSRTDVLETGRSTKSGKSVVFVVEARWRAHTGDVDSQAGRRRILSERGVDALAIIASTEEPSEHVRSYATNNGVLLETAPEAHAA